MLLLSFEEAIRHRTVPLDDAPLTTALELLWRAHRYAVDSNSDVWEFAVEIDEFRRAHVSNSELRWLVNQGYAAHAIETASANGRRRFLPNLCASISEASCFIISEAGVALVEPVDVAVARKPFAPTRLSTRLSEADGGGECCSSFAAKPNWDAQRRELWVAGRMVKRLRQQMSNQQAILDAFEAAKWPSLIINPLPLQPAICPKRRLHDAIKCLNRYHRHEAIRFRGDGSGSGVLWERFA